MAKDKSGRKVTFIRKGGRVIPIRSKGALRGKKKKKVPLTAGQHGLRWLGGQAAGVASGAALQIGQYRGSSALQAIGLAGAYGSGIYSLYHGAAGIYKGFIKKKKR